MKLMPMVRPSSVPLFPMCANGVRSSIFNDRAQSEFSLQIFFYLHSGWKLQWIFLNGSLLSSVATRREEWWCCTLLIRRRVRRKSEVENEKMSSLKIFIYVVHYCLDDDYSQPYCVVVTLSPMFWYHETKQDFVALFSNAERYHWCTALLVE